MTTNKAALDSAYIHAITNGSERDVLNAIENGANVNVVNEIGQSGLILAVEKGDEAMAKLLIANGVDVNMQDVDGYTALYGAADAGNKSMVDLLLKANADPDIASRRGQVPIMRTPLMHKLDTTILNALIAHHANLNLQEKHNGETVLMIAVRSYLMEEALSYRFKYQKMKAQRLEQAIDCLLNANANTLIKDNGGDSVCDVIAKSANEELKQRIFAKAEQQVLIHDNQNAVVSPKKKQRL